MAVDVMRGVAIVLVFVYHAGPLAYRLAPYDASGRLSLGTGWTPSLAWLLVPFFHFGYVGVHAFFVISGFCIHLGAARRKHATQADGVSIATIVAIPDQPRPPTWKTFYLRRFYRIYPPYWIALLIFGCAVPLCARLLGHDRPPFPSVRDLLAHAAMLHTFFQSTIFSINNAWWSIATEEQFYLAYPLLAIALLRFGVRRVLLAALLVSLCWRATVLAVLPPTVAHFMAYRVWLHGFFVPRWFEWILGCLLAEAIADPKAPLDGERRRFFTLAAILFGAAVTCRLHVVVDKLFSDALFSSGFAAIIAGLLDASPARRAAGRASDPDPSSATSPPLPVAAPSLLSRALRAAGRRAYGTYLVHQPILDAPASPLVTVPLALLASAVFSRACEAPFERRSRSVGRRLDSPVENLPPHRAGSNAQ